MDVHFTMRTFVVNQTIRFVEGIWLHRKIRKIRLFSRKIPILHHTCATCAELPFLISTDVMRSASATV